MTQNKHVWGVFFPDGLEVVDAEGAVLARLRGDIAYKWGTHTGYNQQIKCIQRILYFASKSA